MNPISQVNAIASQANALKNKIKNPIPDLKAMAANLVPKNLFQTLLTAFFLPKRSIGGFQATITLEETANDELEITQHPVQQGADITDHAFKKPSTVNINMVFGATIIPLSIIYQRLLALQESREPIDVVTGKRMYKNMLIKSISQKTDIETENVLSISMQLQEIFITSVEVVSVPARKKQKKAAKTGKTEKAGEKKPEPVPKKKQSALREFLG